MAQIIRTPRNDDLVGTSVNNSPTGADDNFGLAGADRIAGRTGNHRRHTSRNRSPRWLGTWPPEVRRLARRIEELEASRVLCDRQGAERRRAKVRRLTFKLEELKQAILAAEVPA